MWQSNVSDCPQRVFKVSSLRNLLKFLIKRSLINWQMYMRSIYWQAMPKVEKKSYKQLKFVKEMRERQMRKKRGTSKTCVEKSSIPGVDVHVAKNNLVFCCYTCTCCLKLYQADYHVEECLIILFYFFVGRWVGGRWKGVGVYLDLVGEHCTQLQCIYYLVPYTDLLAAEGISKLKTKRMSRKKIYNKIQQNRTSFN